MYQVSQQGKQAEDGRHLCGKPHVSHRRGHPLRGQTLRPSGPVPRGHDGADTGQPLQGGRPHLVPEVGDKGQEQGDQEVRTHTTAL